MEQKPGESWAFWLNKSIKALINNSPTYTFNWKRDRAKERDPILLRLDQIHLELDAGKLVFPKFCLPSAGMNLNVAATNLVPHSAFNPWPIGNGEVRGRLWAHITRIVYDATTANTQAGLGPSLLTNDAMPITLPATGGYAQEVDIWVPPGLYLGLVGTANAGDADRDMTVFGEYVPFVAPFDRTIAVDYPGGYEWP